MTTGIRYKFQGSTLEVQTGLAAGKTITAISKAVEAVVTAATHGYVADDVIQLVGIQGMTQLDNSIQVVDAALTGNTFSLLGVDSTNFDAFVAESPAVSMAKKVVFSDFCEATGFNQQDGSATQIDVTTICSTAKEFELGLSDSGTLTLDFNWAGKTAIQTAIRAAKRAGTAMAIRLTMPGTGGIVVAVGFVLQTSFQAAVDGVWKATMQMKLTGDIVVI